MRVGLGQRFFTGKQIALVRRVIYSTNLRSASITATRTLFLRGAMHLPASVVYLLCAVAKERKTTFCIWVVDNPVK